MRLQLALVAAAAVTAVVVAAAARTNQLLDIPLQQEMPSRQPSALVVQVVSGVELHPLQVARVRFQRTDHFLQ